MGSATSMAGMPTEPTLHGAPVRQYLNSKVTVHLVEGMKMLAKEQYVASLQAPPLTDLEMINELC